MARIPPLADGKPHKVWAEVTVSGEVEEHERHVAAVTSRNAQRNRKAAATRRQNQRASDRMTTTERALAEVEAGLARAVKGFRRLEPFMPDDIPRTVITVTRAQDIREHLRLIETLQRQALAALQRGPTGR